MESRPLVLKETYLSHSHYSHGGHVSFCVITFMSFLSTIYWYDMYGLSSQLPAIPLNVFQKKEYWRIFSSIFIHSDGEHFLSNAFSLILWGQILYTYFGRWLYPVLTLILAALTNLFILLTYPPDTILLGASGWVYCLGGCWFALYMGLERKHSLGLRLFRALGVALIIFFPTTFLPQVSYRTHALGFALGFIGGLIYFFFRKEEFYKQEVYREEEVEVDDEADAEAEVEKSRSEINEIKVEKENNKS